MILVSEYPALEQWLFKTMHDQNINKLLHRARPYSELFNSIMGAGCYIVYVDDTMFQKLCREQNPGIGVTGELTRIRSFDPGIAKHIIHDLFGATLRSAQQTFAEQEQEIIVHECAKLTARGLSVENALKILQVAQGDKQLAHDAITWVRGVPHFSPVDAPMLLLLLRGALASTQQQMIPGFLRADIIGKAESYLTGDERTCSLFLKTAYAAFPLYYRA